MKKENDNKKKTKNKNCIKLKMGNFSILKHNIK